eukprot:gnl/MRDRNA2_/MRDRNA2_119255_c0_seq1.p1 gnl/MRDRNA2_/MRDRNA2_119255_c0~~gnl/MRDRNA2_/MRDRNA2_119255_c0_seq1.p1  ORF type:complete len:372 (-),score=32.56 gnl/MRDRNA2_/MRDRNA2_119255_c0_seq1:65-1180(-)
MTACQNDVEIGGHEALFWHSLSCNCHASCPRFPGKDIFAGDVSVEWCNDIFLQGGTKRGPLGHADFGKLIDRPAAHAPIADPRLVQISGHKPILPNEQRQVLFGPAAAWKRCSHATRGAAHDFSRLKGRPGSRWSSSSRPSSAPSGRGQQTSSAHQSRSMRGSLENKGHPKMGTNTLGVLIESSKSNKVTGSDVQLNSVIESQHNPTITGKESAEDDDLLSVPLNPCKAVPHLYVENTDESSVHVCWSFGRGHLEPAPAGWEVELCAYNFTDLNYDDEAVFFTVPPLQRLGAAILAADQRDASLDDLRPNRRYKVRVRALLPAGLHPAGLGPWSDFVTADTRGMREPGPMSKPSQRFWHTWANSRRPPSDP